MSISFAASPRSHDHGGGASRAQSPGCSGGTSRAQSPRRGRIRREDSGRLLKHCLSQAHLAADVSVNTCMSVNTCTIPPPCPPCMHACKHALHALGRCGGCMGGGDLCLPCLQTRLNPTPATCTACALSFAPLQCLHAHAHRPGLPARCTSVALQSTQMTPRASGTRVTTAATSTKRAARPSCPQQTS
eukprot:364635-Chlamydomonas_euryale.AAC.6